MKTRLLGTLLLLLFATATLRAQNPLMKAERIPWWDAEYLTLIWSGGIRSNDPKTIDYINSLVGQTTSIDQSRTFSATEPSAMFGSRVVSVDGTDGRNLTESHFNEIMAAPGVHTLVLDHPSQGQYRVETTQTFPLWMQAYGFDPRNISWTQTNQQVPNNIKIRVDKNVPWRKFRTYDIMVLSDDVLADRELLEKVAHRYDVMGFVRDTENPDILITLTKDANKSVDYTYVPETTEHVQTGSTSYAMYGWKGKYLGNFSVNDYKTVKSGGYTQKTSTTTAYLEVTVLEASRMGERTIPMIYQLKYNYNNNSDENVDELYTRAISWIEHPLYDEPSLKVYKSEKCNYNFWNNLPLINFGIVVNSRSEVVGLDPKSEVATECRLQKGDRIVSIQSTRHRPLSGGSRKITWSGTITVNRNGQNVKLPFKGCHRTNEYSQSFNRVYDVFK